MTGGFTTTTGTHGKDEIDWVMMDGRKVYVKPHPLIKKHETDTQD